MVAVVDLHAEGVAELLPAAADNVPRSRRLVTNARNWLVEVAPTGERREP